MARQRMLVTGSAGFLGCHLVDALLDRGECEVYGVDDLSGGFERNVNPKSQFTILDLRDKEKTRQYIHEIKPEIIFHLAATASVGLSQFTPIASTERNYNAYLNVLIPAIQTGSMKRMVLTSSMDVYGDQKPPFHEGMERRPDDIYAIAKTAMERATEVLSDVHHFEYAIIRPHNVYGPRQNLSDPYRNVVGIFINRLLQHKHYYIYGDGEQIRSFTYVDDFTPYILRSGFDPACGGQIFNIGPKEEHTINQLSDIVLSAFFGSPKETPEPLRPHHLPPRPKEVREMYCTSEKAEQILGYRTTIPLEEGIAKMIAWAKEIGPQQPSYLSSLEIVNDATPATWKDKLI
jgi:UDP-glucose 4-epimerase